MIYKRSFLGFPIARRSNRRLLVAAWWSAVALLFSFAALLLNAHGGWPQSVLFGYLYFFAFLAINSLSRFVWVPRPDPKKFSEGIRTLFDASFRAEMKKNPPPDEREERGWDKATRKAYGLVILAFLLFLAIHYFGLMPRSRVFREFLICFVLFVMLQLPNALYLWNEPDMEEPHED